MQLPTSPQNNEDVCDASWLSYILSYSLITSARCDAILPLSTMSTDAKSTNIRFGQHGRDLKPQPFDWGSDVTEWKPERWLAPLPESVVRANIQGIYANM
jgi:hypothetical protein